ncbi:MAG: hypothetical protein WEE53_01050 [Acidimicrobiia bacterium]
MSEPRARNPKAEATSLLPTGHEARVLEPSPPANTDPAWYADDPTDPTGAKGEIVTPIRGEGISWDEISHHNPELGGYASDHWLGSHRRLELLPPGYETTRRSLHQVAFFAIAPKRHAATGKLGLRYTHRGFGTPFFGDDEQVRIEGGSLVHQQGSQVSATTLTSPEEACEFLGIPYQSAWFEDFHDPLTPAGAGAHLEVTPEAAESLADWLGFATLILEQARRTPGAEDVARVQVWPEHFDPAFEMGSYEKGQRASYGASPGDQNHREPYLYVAAWGEIDHDDPFWSDTTFNGASLSYRELLDADDQKKTALDFLQRGFAKLTR